MNQHHWWFELSRRKRRCAQAWETVLLANSLLFGVVCWGNSFSWEFLTFWTLSTKHATCATISISKAPRHYKSSFTLRSVFVNTTVLIFGCSHQSLIHLQENIGLLLFAFQNHQGLALLLHVFKMFDQLKYGARCAPRIYTQMHELHMLIQVWKQTNIDIKHPWDVRNWKVQVVFVTESYGATETLMAPWFANAFLWSPSEILTTNVASSQTLMGRP